MKNLMNRLIHEQHGQDVIEYVLIAAAISVVAIPFVPAIGTKVAGLWTYTQTQVDSISTGGGS